MPMFEATRALAEEVVAWLEMGNEGQVEGRVRSAPFDEELAAIAAISMDMAQWCAP